MTQHLTGLIVPTFTPMRSDGSLDLDAIDKLAHALIDDGADGAFVCGSTGESVSLTIPERIESAQRWRASIGENIPVIVHVGNSCLNDCKTLAAHAQKIGVSAVAAMAPCFFKPATVEDLALFCAEIAAAAPELPFYFYHMPARTGVTLPMVDFLEAAAEKIPNLAGIKFTSNDLMDLGRCLRFDGGRFNILSGCDEIFLPGLAIGATGAVGTTFNFAFSLYRRILIAFQSGDMTAAQDAQAKSRDLIAVLSKFGGLSACKAAMKIIGLDCGPVRLPLRNLSPEEYDALQAELDRIGFFEFRR
jgi:N-acetylneuraminate lyase